MRPHAARCGMHVHRMCILAGTFLNCAAHVQALSRAPVPGTRLHKQ